MTTTTPTTTETSPIPFTIYLSAENGAFDKKDIWVNAGEYVEIVFNNKDSIPHNVAIYKTEEATEVIFVGEIITGPQTIIYRFYAPLTPDKYFFRCDIHPTTMTGNFYVEGTVT
jgi:plastocyanin